MCYFIFAPAVVSDLAFTSPLGAQECGLPASPGWYSSGVWPGPEGLRLSLICGMSSVLREPEKVIRWELPCVPVVVLRGTLTNFPNLIFLFHSGWISSLTGLNKNIPVGIMMIIIAALFTASAVVSLVMFKKVSGTWSLDMVQRPRCRLHQPTLLVDQQNLAYFWASVCLLSRD